MFLGGLFCACLSLRMSLCFFVSVCVSYCGRFNGMVGALALVLCCFVGLWFVAFGGHGVFVLCWLGLLLGWWFCVVVNVCLVGLH